MRTRRADGQTDGRVTTVEPPKGVMYTRRVEMVDVFNSAWVYLFVVRTRRGSECQYLRGPRGRRRGVVFRRAAINDLRLHKHTYAHRAVLCARQTTVTPSASGGGKDKNCLEGGDQTVISDINP